jgi:hypothetical protein
MVANMLENNGSKIGNVNVKVDVNVYVNVNINVSVNAKYKQSNNGTILQ